MLVVIGKLALQPGSFDKVEDAVLTLLAKARADEGCISYDFARDVENPDVIRFAERWRNMALLDAHNAQPHMAELRIAAEPYLTETPEVAVYQVNEG